MKNFILVLAILLLLSVATVFSQSIDRPYKVEKTGQGSKSIIFIPGFASSGDVWHDTRASFESNFTCHTFTMAGFAGVSPQANPTFEKWERGIAAYISTYQLGKVIVVGHSMGGALAMALAADYPELVDRLVVVDAVPCLAALMNPAFQSNPNNDCTAIVNQVMNLNVEQFTAMQRTTMASMVTDASKIDMIVNWSLTSDRRTFAEMYCDFSNTDLRKKIASITAPSLILLEPSFQNVPAVAGQYLPLKSATLKYATKGLHFIMYDDTKWFMENLTAFVNSQP
jgi:pimeloyl-ACP methyl ester carboxylesterase